MSLSAVTFISPLPLPLSSSLSPLEKHIPQQAHSPLKAVCYLPILLSGEYFIVSFKYHFHMEEVLVSRSGFTPRLYCGNFSVLNHTVDYDILPAYLCQTFDQRMLIAGYEFL